MRSVAGSLPLSHPAFFMSQKIKNKERRHKKEDIRKIIIKRKLKKEN